MNFSPADQLGSSPARLAPRVVFPRPATGPKRCWTGSRPALLRGLGAALVAFSALTRAAVVDIGPLDSTLTHPVNPVAKNFGVWNGNVSTVVDTLEFRKNGFKGFDYHECAGTKQFHAQHVARLPNKNGLAYFVVTGSGAWVSNWPLVPSEPDGTMSVYRADSLDLTTDRVRNLPGTDGEIVWERRFDQDNPVGSWNHPCMMQCIGNLLVVCMQNWSSLFACRDGWSSNPDALLFYDVRDPENPVYWGRMTAEELGVSEVSEVGLFKAGEEWILNVYSRWWRTKTVSPDLGSWTFGGGNANEPGWGGSHGNFFRSLEQYDPASSAPPGTTLPGTERVMWFDGKVKSNVIEWFEFSSVHFTPGPPYFIPGTDEPELGPVQDRAAPDLFDNGNNDYDACGIYVTGGVPIIYSALQDYGGDVIYQIWDPGNVRTPLDLPGALDAAGLAWTTSGSTFKADWTGQINFAHDGTDAAMSGPLNHSQFSRLEATVTGPGILRFFWKVSSERNPFTGAGADFLRFAVDGVADEKLPGISGEVDWRQHTVAIPPGFHVLSWTYSKDANDLFPVGFDAGFVDQVSFGRPAITVESGSTGDSGPGTLRQAITDVESGGTIVLKTDAVRLTGGPLLISKNITIVVDRPYWFNNRFTESPGATITGNHTQRVLEIAPGAVLTLRGVAVTEGAGGILNHGTLVLDGCTLYGNDVPGDWGGGVSNHGTLAMTNCTVANNSSAYGGGIFSDGSATLTHTTVSDNSATGGGGGLFVNGGVVEVNNTIIARNTGPYADAGVVAVATLTQTGVNLIGVDPKLTPLGYHGGATLTMQLLPGSPALDAAAPGPTRTDQRGFSRSRDGDAVAGAVPDLGAYEAQAAPFSMGLNFVGSAVPLAAADVAGAPGFAQAFWNNLTTDFDGTGGGTYFYGPATLLEASGVPVADYGPDSVSPRHNPRLWWDAPNVWGKNPATVVTADDKLMSGYLDSSGAGGGSAASNLYSTTGAQPFLAVADLPAAAVFGGYHVVVYVDGDATDGRTGKYWLTSNQSGNPADTSREVTYPMSHHQYSDGRFSRDARNFSGAYIEDLASEPGGREVPGNYLVFRGASLTEPGFILRADEASPLTGSNARAPINAIQVVRNEIIVVTTAEDELDPYGTLGAGVSLREALRDAPNAAGILFDPAVFDGRPASTIHLTRGALFLKKGDIVIDASNIPNGVTLDAGGSSRVFTIATGSGDLPRIRQDPTTALHNLTITGGSTGVGVEYSPDDYNTSGGAITCEYGALTLNHCTISGNSSRNGPGVSVSGGGAIFCRGRLVLNDCTLSSNTVFGTTGGAIWAENCVLNNCTLSANSSLLGGGGAIYAVDCTLNNCTLSGNSTTAGSSLPGKGGAIWNGPTYGKVALHHVTLSGNSAADGGGLSLSSPATLNNVIVAGNTAPAHPDVAGSFTGSHNLIGGDPLLAPLGDFGGPTQTMPPRSGSPALDAGAGSALRTDQRGLARLSGRAADIGAVESQQQAEHVAVTSAADHTPGSLRQAIQDATAGTTITFAQALNGQTITLADELLVGAEIVIDAGDLSNGITISGDGARRIFIVSSGASLTLRSLTLARGHSDGRGGAILGELNSALNLDRCTLTGNDADEGGALFCLGSLTLSQCTLAGNTAAWGGALECLGSASIIRCTIAGNYAVHAGGGIYNKNTTLTVESSIVAANSAGEIGGDVVNENAVLIYSGASLVQSVANSGGSVSGPAAIAAHPRLASLANYGGPTRTMPPLPGSPAINTGGATTLITDQRGLDRLSGGASDIGAVELQGGHIAISISISGAGATRTISWFPVAGTLERAASLMPGSAWTTVGTTSPVTISVGAGMQFYRLRQ